MFPPYPESHSSASHVSFLERAMPAVEEWRLQRPANTVLGIYKGIVIYCCSARLATLEGVKMGKKTALCWTGVLEQYPRTRRLLILYSTAWSNHQATDINKKKKRQEIRKFRYKCVRGKMKIHCEEAEKRRRRRNKMTKAQMINQ